jgi:hypothetical protein
LRNKIAHRKNSKKDEWKRAGGLMRETNQGAPSTDGARAGSVPFGFGLINRNQARERNVHLGNDHDGLLSGVGLMR